MTDAIDELAEKVADEAHENAVEVIAEAHEIAATTHETAAEAVQTAAETIANLGDKVNEKDEALEWKLATQQQLTELAAKLELIPQTIQANHSELLNQMAQLIPAPVQNLADEAAPLEVTSEAEATAPEVEAESQAPARKKHQFL